MTIERSGLIVLVCGGRTYNEVERVYRELDRLHDSRGVGCLVQGGARGADRLARGWAFDRRIPQFECAAHWETMGGAAGPIRNQWMLDWMQPEIVVAFPGNTGTADMVRRARRAGVEVMLIHLKGDSE